MTKRPWLAMGAVAAAFATVLGADTGRPGPSEVPAEREVRERARDWELLRDGGALDLRTDHFSVRGSDECALRLAGVVAESVVEALQAAVGGDASEHLLLLRIAEPEARGDPSFYDARRFEAVVRRDALAGRAVFARRVRREVARLYLHRLFGERPAWFAEGLAEWVENAVWTKGALRCGAEAPHHREAMARDRSPAAPEDLLRMSRDDLRGAARARAWALVTSLAARDRRILARLAAGAELSDVADLRAIAKEWRRP